MATLEDFLKDVRTDGGPTNYNKWASKYDELVGDQWHYVGYKSVVSKWQQYYNGALKGNVKQTVLDAGCGTGYIGEYIASIGNLPVDLYGGDYSPKMLEMAEKKNVYTDLKVINMKTELPYESETFDAILSSGVFSKSTCHANCLPNLYRVLKKGGHVIVTAKSDLYEMTKDDWDTKYTKEYNCDILEVEDMPYHDESGCLVFVIRKN